MRVEDRVIPARFLVTIGHLIAVLMVFKTKVDNVYVGLGNDPTAAQVASAEDDVDGYVWDMRISKRIPTIRTVSGRRAFAAKAALAVALVCFGLDFISLFLGLSIFMMKVNVLQTLTHFVGAILIAQFITEEWDYRALWRIVGWCNVPTAVVEVGVIVAVFYVKAVVY